MWENIQIIVGNNYSTNPEYIKEDLDATKELFDSNKEFEELKTLWDKMKKCYPKNKEKAYYLNAKLNLKEYPLLSYYVGTARVIRVKVLLNSRPLNLKDASLYIKDKYYLKIFEQHLTEIKVEEVVVDNAGYFKLLDGTTGKILYNMDICEDVVLLRKLVKKAWWYNLYLYFVKFK